MQRLVPHGAISRANVSGRAKVLVLQSEWGDLWQVCGHMPQVLQSLRIRERHAVMGRVVRRRALACLVRLGMGCRVPESLGMTWDRCGMSRGVSAT